MVPPKFIYGNCTFLSVFPSIFDKTLGKLGGLGCSLQEDVS